MSMKMILALGAALTAVAAAPVFAQDVGNAEAHIQRPDPDPPAGPVVTVGADGRPVATGVVGATGVPEARRAPRAFDPPRAPRPGASISVTPNRNTEYSISLFHVNRLITPFEDVLIDTSSTAGVSVHGNIVNVIADRQDPIGLFIYDRAAPTQAISLTLHPAEVAPVSVTIDVEGWTREERNPFARTVDPRSARAWETEAPYISTLKELFKGLALGEVPDGYGLRTLGPQDRGQIPYCQFQGLQVEPLQVLEGYSVNAYVARVTNISYGVVELSESACRGGELLAVSAWPTNRLAPGQEVELYLAVKTPEVSTGRADRPSVIRSGR